MFVGNDDVWASLSEHLQTSWRGHGLRMDVDSVVIVTGPTGCGKSTGVGAVLRTLGYHITPIDCWNAREMKDAITTACRCPLLATLQSTLDQPRILLMDSMEVAVEFDASVPAALHTLVRSKGLPHMLIMCVMDECVSARFSKFPHVFRLCEPTHDDIKRFVTHAFGSMHLDRVESIGGNMHALRVVLHEGLGFEGGTHKRGRSPIAARYACVKDMLSCRGHPHLADALGGVSRRS